MKRLILRLAVAILAFGFGVVVDRAWVRPKGNDVPKVQAPVVVVEKPVVVPAVAVKPTPAPTPHTVFDFAPANFDPSGNYFILGGRQPGFDEFHSLLISSWEEKGKLKGNVWIQAYSDRRLEIQPADFVFVTRRRVLIVSTQPSQEGFEYRFDGEFVADLDKFVNKRKGVVRGTLTKVKWDKKVAERVVSFWLEAHVGC